MAEPNYSLSLSQSKSQGFTFVEDLTHIARDWNRSIRWQGGYWMGSFKIEDDMDVLQEWFYNRLGYHVSERAAGAVTWEGMIYAPHNSIKASGSAGESNVISCQLIGNDVTIEGNVTINLTFDSNKALILPTKLDLFR